MQDKLILLRKHNNLTQSELADSIGISTRNYADKELGKKAFSLDEAFKISDYFNLTLNEIFLPRTPQNGSKK